MWLILNRVLKEQVGEHCYYRREATLDGPPTPLSSQVAQEGRQILETNLFICLNFTGTCVITQSHTSYSQLAMNLKMN
jgi:hypothetical protein